MPISIRSLATPQAGVCTAIAVELRAPFALPAPLILGGDPPA